MTKSLLIPLGVFVMLVVILAAGFWLEDPHRLPSEMINRELPAFSLTKLDDGTAV